MGIGYHDLRLMWNARQSGTCFDRVLTIGRQSLCLHPAELEQLVDTWARALGHAPSLPAEHCAFGARAEPFLQAFLGAGSVEAVDYSDYEGAQHLHDMNEPVPEAMIGRFDAVFDGGALEHIFNFPVAVANLMRMTKVGGHVFMSTPANNFFGHGFYQFSPELMFRVFAPENGFEIRTVQILETRYPSPELSRNRTAYEVTDPATVHCRVGLLTKRPVLMLVEARKLEHKPLFARTPLQSDYVTEWSAARLAARRATPPPVPQRTWRSRASAMLPWSLRAKLTGWAQKRRYSLANQDFYRKVP
jgi:SAM-dependent methyltransferase